MKKNNLQALLSWCRQEIVLTAALLLAACLFPAPKSLAEERLWDVE